MITWVNKTIDSLERFKQDIPLIISETIKNNEEIVLEYVSEDQLYERGVDGKENFIADSEPYSPITISIKREKGQPTSRVTLRDSGDFHESFFIEYTAEGFEIRASDYKFGDLVSQYGEAIMALTDENLQDLLRNYILPDLLQKIRKI